MTFKTKFSSQATKFLRKQDKHISERLKISFRKLEDDPFLYVEHYEGGNYYKFRIGDYRALLDIDLQNKIIWIRVLDKRGRIYNIKKMGLP